MLIARYAQEVCSTHKVQQNRTHVDHSLTCYIHTYTRLMALCPGLPGSAGTRKVKPTWILLKQETVSGSGISWAICKSASRSRQKIMPVPHHSVFTGRMPFPAAQPSASKHEGKLKTCCSEENSKVLSWQNVVDGARQHPQLERTTQRGTSVLSCADIYTQSCTV